MRRACPLVCLPPQFPHYFSPPLLPVLAGFVLLKVKFWESRKTTKKGKKQRKMHEYRSVVNQLV